MNPPRKNHFVSQFTQRRFVDPGGRVHVFDKRRPEAGIRPVIPKEAFVQKDLYTIELKDGSKQFDLENWYSKLETQVAPIIDKIIERARAGKVPGLTGDERNIWDKFFYHQQKRAPDVFERLGLVRDFDRDLPDFIAEFERRGRPLTDEERVSLQSSAAKQRMIQMASVKARGRGSEEVAALLAAHGTAVSLVKSSRKSFILGDHPQARLG